MIKAATCELGSSADITDNRQGTSLRHGANLTVPHKILNWPVIQSLFFARRPAFAKDLREIFSQGSRWFVERSSSRRLGQKETKPQYVNGNEEESDFITTSSLQLLRLYGEVASKGYVEAYFRTFNLLSPILDQATFGWEMDPQSLLSIPTNGGVEIVLLLLVIALGQVAYEGSAGDPIEQFKRRSSGLRGGTALFSPGDTCFDQALRQWKLVPNVPSLQRAQALLLQATFCGSSAKHWDFWQHTVAASTMIETLIRSPDTDWNTTTGEMLKRAYWACVLDEGFYHHDMDLPQTGIFALQDEVPLPSFVCDTDGASLAEIELLQVPASALQFLASISLKRLVDRIHDVVHECIPSSALGITAHDCHPVFPHKVLSELNSQLRSWRALLPSELQWSDSHRNELSDPSHFHWRARSVSGLDVMIAQLRARFYNARFTLLSPSLYLLLHHPERLSADDKDHCASAFDSTLLWPLATPSVGDQKRLIPYHFTWTQNAVSFLCMYVMIREDEVLKTVCEQNLNLRELRVSVAVQLCWLQDMKAVDETAEWVWRLLHPMFVKEIEESPDKRIESQ